MTRAALVLLLACSCAPGRWSVFGCPAGWNVDLAVSVAEQVTGDRGDYLARGGTLTCQRDLAVMDEGCAARPPLHAAGCSVPGEVWVLLGGPYGASGAVFGPAEQTTALAHELCHLGLDGRSYVSTDAEANACADTVNGLLP